MNILDAKFVQDYIRMADDGWQQGWHMAPVLGNRDPNLGPCMQPHVVVWQGRLALLFGPRKQR